MSNAQKSETPLDVETLEASFAAIAPQADELVARFYSELFCRHPAVEPLFADTDIKTQQGKLVAALKLVVENVRNPDKLLPVLREMGRRHEKYGAVADHYGAVAETLLDVMAEVAGAAWTPKVRTAWADALGVIADTMLSAYQDTVEHDIESRNDTEPNEECEMSTESTAAENSRIKQALDAVTANVMVADANLDIIYMNDTVREMFQVAELDIQKDLPNFNVRNLMGTNIDDFHKNPAHQRRMLADLSGTFESQLELGGRTFGIIANPIVADDGERIGTVVEWQDKTERLAREEEERQREEQERAAAAENGRVKQALDNVSANVMVADANLDIIYMNDTVREMFQTAESDIRKDLPNFNAGNLMGTNIDDFHKNPAHQRRMLAELSGTFESQLELGGRTFGIIANPIVADDGERIGTVVEWQDKTDRLAREEEERQRIEAERLIAAENGRIKQALKGVTTNVMIGDNDLNIIYMNDAVSKLFREVEADVRKDIPGFDANNLIGTCIDMFHKNPSHQRNMLARLSATHTAELQIGGRTMRVIASPVFDDDGERLGTVVEWADRTQELAVESEVQEVVEGALAGDLTKRISLDGKDGFFERLSTAVNDLVGVAEQVITDTVRVLSAMSTGNLTETIAGDYEGSFGRLKEDANTTVSKLTDVVSRIQTASNSVKVGADEISQGNTDLSQRTEEQASSLEETASSMEEMTSTVKQNADNATEANQLAMAAREQAEKGGSVVRQAVDAMNEINASSKKISDIIGVIDEIAFQTNLLALNASVEAARAGDQGRGFAVVASEVRNLAGRSATAAKEIKDLIEDSGRKVDEGSRLVNDSGETLDEIVSGVKKVTDIVGEIAAASQEQSAGIEQVNKAVMQLDELTQQNAALVEQAAAASESMGEQADGLNEMMRFFTVMQNGQADVHVGGAPGGVERRSEDRPWTAPATPSPAMDPPAAAPARKKVAANGGDHEWEEF